MSRQLPDIIKDMAPSTEAIQQALLIDEAITQTECPLDSLALYDTDWTDPALQLGCLKFLRLSHKYYPPLDNASKILAQLLPQLRESYLKEWIYTVYELRIQVPKKIIKQLIVIEHPEIRSSLTFLLSKQDWPGSREYLASLCESESVMVSDWAKYHLKKRDLRTENYVSQSTEEEEEEESENELLDNFFSAALKRSKRQVSEAIREELRDNGVGNIIIKTAGACKLPSLYAPIWWNQWSSEASQTTMETALRNSFWDHKEATTEIAEKLTSPELGQAHRQELLFILLRRPEQYISDLAQSWMNSKHPILRSQGAVISLFHGGPRFPGKHANMKIICDRLRFGEVLTAASLVPFLAKISPSILTQALDNFRTHQAPLVTWNLKSVIHRWGRLPPEHQVLRCLHTPTHSTRIIACMEFAETIDEMFLADESEDGSALKFNSEFTFRESTKVESLDYVGTGSAKLDPKKKKLVQSKYVSPQKPFWQHQFDKLARRYSSSSIFGFGFIFCLGIALLGAFTFHLIEQSISPKPSEQVFIKSEEIAQIEETKPDLLVDPALRTNGMYSAQRVSLVAKLSRDSILQVLLKQSDRWSLYNRIDVVDSAAIIAKIEVHQIKPESTYLEAMNYLLDDLEVEISEDRHEKVAKLLISLTAYNSKVGDWATTKTLDRIDKIPYHNDSLVLKMAEISSEFRTDLRKAGMQSKYHPALQKFKKSTLHQMVEILDHGWVRKKEKLLGGYLTHLSSMK
ncbi:MAG: hypothetical protein VYA34_16220 [Myxococcota bacterium]|nr:hypothetical protein [Myxococcota bacterium]